MLEDKDEFVSGRLFLRVLVMMALAMVAIFAIAVAALFLYEPSPTEGLAFMLTDDPDRYNRGFAALALQQLAVWDAAARERLVASLMAGLQVGRCAR